MTKIKIYSTPTCPHCVQAKEFFKEKNIEYEDIDVSENPKAAEEMQKLSGGTTVPVIDIDRKIFTGFDQEKIEQALK